MQHASGPWAFPPPTGVPVSPGGGATPAGAAGPPPVPAPASPFDRLTVWQQAWRLGLALLVGLVLWLTVAGVATEGFSTEGELSPLATTLLLLDPLLGLLGLVIVAFRRRWPVVVAVVTGVLCFVSMTAVGPAILALVSLATRRHAPTLAAVTVLNLTTDAFYEFVVTPLLQIESEVAIDGDPIATGLGGSLVSLGFVLLIYVICILIGWNVGSRRELVRSWRTGADTANREQAARVAQAQLAERARIAREMHDVLAHRLSLVAMHAGVLAHRTDLPEEERREAAEVVRAGAHQALEELREVLGVLRADGDASDEGGPALTPQPDLSEIPALVAELTSSGQEVHLVADAALWPQSVSLPTSTGRHAYRVVQEALTNARKHATGSAATVELAGRPGKGLSIVVANPVPAIAEGSLPSGGRGLTGMAERVQLAGGRFEAGVEVTRFVVRVWLPWPRQGEKRA